MNENLANIHFSQVVDYNYEAFFNEVKYNGKTLSDKERKEVIAIIDNIISQYSEGLPMMQVILNNEIELPPEFYEIERTVVSVMQFTYIVMLDSMVASKYFIQADNDYERSFMRGKLAVILNEGIKRLYGFDKKTKITPEWKRIMPILKYFPKVIHQQYDDLTWRLDKLAKSGSWWQNERNYETHFDAEPLYASRQEEVIESKVMMDTMKLFSALLAVNHFLTNIHCLYNYMVMNTMSVEQKD